MNLKKELWTNLLQVKKKVLPENLSEGFINEQEIHQKELEDNENIQQNDNNEGGHDNVQTCNVTILDNKAQNNLEESENIKKFTHIKIWLNYVTRKIK